MNREDEFNAVKNVVKEDGFKIIEESKKNRKVSIKERYRRIAETDEFKKAYVGMSIGESMEIENP